MPINYYSRYEKNCLMSSRNMCEGEREVVLAKISISIDTIASFIF